MIMKQTFVYALFFLSSNPAAAQYSLFACVTSTKDYVVGAQLPPSGLFLKSPALVWQHIAYNHPFLTGIDYDPAEPATVYLSAGNALIQASGRGNTWKFLTGGDVTELRDVAVDRNRPGTLYFAHSHGIRVSHDRGVTWREISGGLHRKYTEALHLDARKSGVLLAGGEEGIFRSEDEGQTWRIAGAAGFQITRIEQSPHDTCEWLATTQKGGLFASRDCGKTFENLGRIGVGSNLYDVVFDPTTPHRVAVAGWGTGLSISGDDGKTWQVRSAGLPRPAVVSVVFDPAKAGRLYASVPEDALYVSNDAGITWTKEGLEGSIVNRLKFVPEAPFK